MPKPTGPERPPHGNGILRLLKAYLAHNRFGDLLVLQGRIAPDTLRHVLKLAKTRDHRIGRVLLDEGIIRKHELYTTLGTQFSVRALAYMAAIVISVGSFAPRVARAADDGAARAAQTITIAYAPQAKEPHAFQESSPRFIETESFAHYPALFGSGEKRSEDLSAFTKWTSMFERFAARQNGDSHIIQVSFSADHAPARIADLARTIDEQINQIPYVDDQQNWGKSDYWATPDEFISRGGDCEDFAIAKYMALKSAGLGDDRMRIAIVHDSVKNIPHAILVVYSEDGPLILDNQSPVTRRADEITRYKPIFSINQTAWWLHTQGADVQVASAAR